MVHLALCAWFSSSRVLSESFLTDFLMEQADVFLKSVHRDVPEEQLM